MRCDKHRKRDRYYRKAHRVKFANITTSPIVSKASMRNESENPSTGNFFSPELAVDNKLSSIELILF